VQAAPIKPKLKPSGSKRLKPMCDVLLSASAFKISLRRYTEVLTRQIASSAQHKQLGKAVAAYRRLVTYERLIPTSYTYASLINAYVNSGHMPGATHMLKHMKAVKGMVERCRSTVSRSVLKAPMVSALEATI